MHTFYRTFLIIICSITFATPCASEAQTIKLLAGNTFNGAMNGAILGGATMALQNSDNFEPIRVGTGVGALYGIGVGIYDLTKISKGEQFYISGTFNDGTNTSIIVLLDTFYGSVAGAVVASSVALITQESFLDALQYGSGTGAWIGAGFGVIDAFILAKGPEDFRVDASVSDSPAGIMNYTSKKKTIEVGFINPSIVTLKEMRSRELGLSHSLELELVNLSVRL